MGLFSRLCFQGHAWRPAAASHSKPRRAVLRSSTSRTQQSQHCGGCGNKGQPDNTRSPKQLLARGALVVERKPVPNESSWNVEYDRVLAGMTGFVIGEHRPDGGQSQPLKLAIPLPRVLAVGPSVFEGKSVRFHRMPPSNLLPSADPL